MKILLFSDDRKVFEVTNSITKEWAELIWYKYDKLERKQYPLSDIVIIHFDKTKILKGTFLPIIRVKSRMGSSIPILAIINGTAQEIFSVLKAGVYDYITTIENVQEYKKKIEDVVRWDWYQKKYGIKKGRSFLYWC